MVKSPMRTFCSFVVADKMNTTNKTLVWPTEVKGSQTKLKIVKLRKEYMLS